MTQDQTAAPAPVGISFADLALSEPIQKAIAEAGYTNPTPIQTQAIPLVLEGGDLMAAAQTGTGKTAGFTLPILHILSAEGGPPQPGRPRCLILTPTRELAAQVEESVQTYGKHLPLTSMVMFGGVAINPQISRLKKRIDILVATPGRLLDHHTQKTVDLSGVEILVLDEADRMLDMGFIRDIKKILAQLPRGRQNLLFSATFSDEIKELADGLLHNPGYVEAARRNTASELVQQTVHICPQKQKRELLVHLVKKHQWFQALVFTRTKHGANKLAEYLVRHEIPAAAIHGNKSQAARTRALADFKEAKLQVLVATDIAARGLDIDQLPQVVNFDLPNVPEDYVHRIGRTGRAGANGAAVSLVDKDELPLLKDIERLMKRLIDKVEVPDFVPATPAAGDAAPTEEARGVHDGGRKQRPPRQPKREGQGPREHRDAKEGREGRENREARAPRKEGEAREQRQPQGEGGQKRQGQGQGQQARKPRSPQAGQGARTEGGSANGHSGPKAAQGKRPPRSQDGQPSQARTARPKGAAGAEGPDRFNRAPRQKDGPADDDFGNRVDYQSKARTPYRDPEAAWNRRFGGAGNGGNGGNG
ncbi:MAG: DEAD/DEAH box helicase, partial [Rhodocyclales bacterium]|nr:DEAD/DEAH box helicase [Rhodocyclales bacterium]